MTQVVVNMKTIDLRKAELQPVAGDDVKTLQALLNLFLTAGDVGEDGSPIRANSGRDGRREDEAGPTRLPNGGPSRHGRYRRPADLEETHRAGLLKQAGRRTRGDRHAGDYQARRHRG